LQKIGEIIADPTRRHVVGCLSGSVLDNLSSIPGKWVAGFYNNGNIKTKISDGILIDRDNLPSPSKLFGVNTGFDIFAGALTGHAFSDMSSGCIYDCDFCSERASICGPLSQSETSANRLFRQLLDIHNVIEEDSPGRKASAFVEDSIILSGLSSQLTRLSGILKDHPINIEFGGQLTIDTAIKLRPIIKNLMESGLKYVFVGLETFDPNSIGGMSKNVGKADWMDRSERVIKEYTEMEMKLGASILFGLGESHSQRLSLVEKIANWKEKYGNPMVTSFNWAVQHPLRGNDYGANYDYLKWGVDSQDFIDAFKDYGEATSIYSIPGTTSPSLMELDEIRKSRIIINQLVK